MIKTILLIIGCILYPIIGLVLTIITFSMADTKTSIWKVILYTIFWPIQFLALIGTFLWLFTKSILK